MGSSRPMRTQQEKCHLQQGEKHPPWAPACQYSELKLPAIRTKNQTLAGHQGPVQSAVTESRGLRQRHRDLSRQLRKTGPRACVRSAHTQAHQAAWKDQRSQPEDAPEGTAREQDPETDSSPLGPLGSPGPDGRDSGQVLVSALRSSVRDAFLRPETQHTARG